MNERAMRKAGRRSPSREELQASYRYLASILKSMLDVVIVTNPDGTIRTVNRAALELLGYSEKELVGQPVGTIFEEEEEEEEEEEAFFRGTGLAKLVREGAVRNVELTLLSKSGERIPVVFNGSVIREEDGRLAAVVGVARDIRERKRAEEALRESEARFRMATEEALAGVYIIQDGKFQYVNPALARIFGYTPQELMGKLGPLDLTHPQDRPLVEKNIRKRLKGEVRAVHYTFRGLCKDGKVIHCEVLGRHIEYQGRPAIMGNLLDITERVQAEEALRESEARYRTLVENANEGIVVVQDGLIKFTNPKFRELSGCTESDLACKHFTEFLHPEERAAALERYQKRMKGETVPSVYSFRAIDKQGKVRWVESKAVLITWEGKPAVLNFLSDITDRVQAQEERRRNFERLRKLLEETVATLAATVELKDPYTAGHQRRVSQLACAIAKELGLPEERIEGLRLAAVVHDIGKMAVPTEILSKPGHLNKLEFDMVKNHPTAGYELLKHIEFPWPVAKIVLQHHERLDGSGYPQGLKGEEILLEARILAVADVVEAMSSHRPYRAALGLEKALEEIERGKGTHYDPQVVDACVRLFKEKAFTFVAR